MSRLREQIGDIAPSPTLSYDSNMRLNQAMIYVKDLDRMAAFYGNALGLKLVEETRMENWVEFEAGATKFSLHTISL